MSNKKNTKHDIRSTMQKSHFWLVFLVSCFLLLASCFFPTLAQELTEQQTVAIKTAGGFAYNIQKYTGFNILTDYVAEVIIKSIVKFKTKADDVSVDFKIYSGWDLFRKKAKSLSIKAKQLIIKNIPVEYCELEIDGPIYLKKTKHRHNRAVFPTKMLINVKINISNVNEVLERLPKWQKILREIELPVPPFGSTKVSLKDLKISIDNSGFVKVDTIVTSLVNPNSEPLKMKFSGDLVAREEKIVVDNLQSEVEGIFTKESDIEKSFSDMLEDLINPVVDFHKIERNGLKIDDVDLSFETNKVLLKVKSRLLPEKNENIL